MITKDQAPFNYHLQKALDHYPASMRQLRHTHSVIYQLILSGRLRNVKEGHTRLVRASAITEYVSLLERERTKGVADRQASLDTKPTGTSKPTTPYARLRRWAHMLGYGGHFLTKARRYSITFRLLRDTRIAFRRTEDQAATEPGTVRAVDHLDDTTLIVGTLTFAGVGWHTNGDALLANTAAAMARARHETGRDELAHQAGSTVAPTLQAA